MPIARPRASRNGGARGSDGFTLVEMLAAMTLMGIIGTIAVGSIRHWAKAQEHEGARRSVVSSLRYAQQRAMAEGKTYCVAFTGDTWNVYRTTVSASGALPAAFTCAGSGIRVKGPLTPESNSVHVSGPAFAEQGAVATNVTYALFYARGTATAGSVTLTRDGSTKSYVVNVEGLTSRVSSD